MEGLFGHVNTATGRTLEVNGYRLHPAALQGCCGALHAHAGRRDDAIRLARANIEAFRATGTAWIAVNSAGCGAMLKDYGHLLRDEPPPLADAARAFSERVRDVSELLATVGPVPGGSLPLKVAYDAPCHLHHAQRVTTAPETVLRAIPDLQLIPHAEADACCGSAGLYSLVERELSLAVLDRKIQYIAEAAPDVLATGNPGCAMHIGAGLLAAGHPVAVVHPVELLEESYRRAGLICPG